MILSMLDKRNCLGLKLAVANIISRMPSYQLTRTTYFRAASLKSSTCSATINIIEQNLNKAMQQYLGNLVMFCIKIKRHYLLSLPSWKDSPPEKKEINDLILDILFEYLSQVRATKVAQLKHLDCVQFFSLTNRGIANITMPNAAGQCMAQNETFVHIYLFN